MRVGGPLPLGGFSYVLCGRDANLYDARFRPFRQFIYRTPDLRRIMTCGRELGSPLLARTIRSRTLGCYTNAPEIVTTVYPPARSRPSGPRAWCSTWVLSILQTQACLRGGNRT